MKPPVMAPLYVAIYPELCELFRSHGFALSIHGSLAKDFDLIAVPWAESVSSPETVLQSLESEFGMKSVHGAVATQKNHGRKCYTVIMGCGTCYIDLSFVLC